IFFTSYLFFYPAEDGIRYRNVTGVQTCALPISPFFYCLQIYEMYVFIFFNEHRISKKQEPVKFLLVYLTVTIRHIQVSRYSRYLLWSVAFDTSYPKPFKIAVISAKVIFFSRNRTTSSMGNCFLSLPGAKCRFQRFLDGSYPLRIYFVIPHFIFIL